MTSDQVGVLVLPQSLERLRLAAYGLDHRGFPPGNRMKIDLSFDSMVLGS